MKSILLRQPAGILHGDTETRRKPEVELTKFMKLAKSQAKEIRALKRMKDEDIDFSDIPELRGDEKFVVGKFYRPIKKLVAVQKIPIKTLKPTMH